MADQRGRGGSEPVIGRRALTGATGKVGRNLVAGLAAGGFPVRALTRDPATARVPAGAEAVRFDSAQPDTFGAALTGATAVFVNPAAAGGATPAFLATTGRNARDYGSARPPR